MLLGTVLLLSQAAFPFFGAEARTNEPVSTQSDKVIMLVVDALSVADFIGDASGDPWPHLRAAVVEGDGAIGLMNTRTAGPNTSAAAHVTIGAGDRARAGPLSALTFHSDTQYRDELVSALYESSTGHPSDGAALLFLGIGELRTLAAMPSGPFSPGALGQALADAGVRTAVIGNADGHDSFRRHAPLIAIDSRGRIPHGIVGRELLANDDAWPFRHRTDYDATWEAFVGVYDAADFIVIELGDFARLDTYTDWVTAERMNVLRRDAGRRIDEFIGRLHRWPAAAGQTLLLVSPSPPTAALRRGWLLAPVAWTTLGEGGISSTGGGTPSTDGKPSGGPEPKLVTSNTTRRAGIVTNTDIAPTILGAFGISSAAFSGTSMRGVPLSSLVRDWPPLEAGPGDAWTAVQRLYERATLTNSLRSPVVQSFIGFSIAVFVSWVAWMTYAALSGSSGPEVWETVWRWILLFLTATPAAILLLPLLKPADASTAMIIVVVVSAALTTIAFAFRRQHVTDGFVAMALVTAAILVMDTAFGARLIKNSILGYDPIVAARFYGIGNEYMGVLIGTALIGTTGLLDAWKPAPAGSASPASAAGRVPRAAPGGIASTTPSSERVTEAPSSATGAERRNPGPGPLALTALVYAAMIVVLASPSLGANVGGTIAAVIGFGTTLMLLSGRKLSWKTALGLTGAVAAVIMAAAFIDVTFNREQPSHLGRLLMAFVADGWEPLFTIVSRKLTMNLRLLRWTIWAQVFVVCLAVSIVLLYRPGPAVQRADQRHPYLLKGIRGAVIAALAALIANDSGVVAAATLMIPVTATLMYVMLVQRSERATP